MTDKLADSLKGRPVLIA